MTAGLLHPDVERVAPDALAPLQERLWEAQWRYVRTRSAFYRRKLGQATGEHAITVNAVTFTDPVTIQGPQGAGSITVDGTLSGTGDASITLTGTGASTTLNADITTEGMQLRDCRQAK